MLETNNLFLFKIFKGEGYKCPSGSHCEVAKDPNCFSNSGLCQSEPICKPDIVYSNPCEFGTPLTSNETNEVLFCKKGV